MTRRVALLLPRMLLCLSGTVACTDPLVNEDYGGRGHKSINGLDLFEEMLADEAEVSHSAYADSARISEADLVVYVQPRPFIAPGEMEAIARALDAAPAAPDVPGTKSGDTSETPDDAPLSPESPDEEGGVLKGDVAEPGHAVSVLILQHGMSASRSFWWRLLQQFPEGAASGRVRTFIEGQLAGADPSSEIATTAHFFVRERLEGSEPSASLWYHPVDRLAFLLEKGSLPARIPVAFRIVDRTTPDDLAVYRRTIVGMPGGAFFAEGVMDRAHLFLVSDSSPFLNYHLALGENRTLLRFVLHRSLKYAASRAKPRILIVGGWKSAEEQLQEERSVLAFLVHAPWNVPFALLVLLFVLFVWARLSREAPVTEIADEDRDGDLLRHFQGLARRIRQARAKGAGWWKGTKERSHTFRGDNNG